MEKVTLSLEEARDRALRALEGAGVSRENAVSVAEASVAANRDGIVSHGLAMMVKFCEHARCGKIDGRAEPVLERLSSAALRVDARDGFAHPAIDLGFRDLVPMARETGVAALALTNSYNCGVLGYHVDRLAQEGLVGLGFTNAPASIAPTGGAKAVVGTNPVALAVPGANGRPELLIDQSSSVVAKSEVVMHAGADKPIPEGWALDADGNPTTDPKAALAGGTMVPTGGAKGVGQALIVEVFAAAIAGATLGIHASSFGDNTGGPPRTGQFFLAVDPVRFGGDRFDDNMQALLSAIESQDGARLPGSRRFQNRRRAETEGIEVSRAVLDKLASYETR